MKTITFLKPSKTIASKTAFFIMLIFISMFGKSVMAQTISEVSRDSTTSTTNSYSDTELINKTTYAYAYTVNNYNGAGNESGQSSSAKADTQSESLSLPIIPGENVNFYGMGTTAGSGRHLETPNTTVYKVTNLNDAGPGSLRYGLSSEVYGPKVIVFEVSGNIELQGPIGIGSGGSSALQDAENWGSYIIIAGQTAPSPGITLKGDYLLIQRNCHDILIQHMRFRFGDEGRMVTDPDFESWDSFITDNHIDIERGWIHPYNIVVDHCSFSWAIDENIQSGADNMSFINNIISEGLNSELHPKGPHSKGYLGTKAVNTFFAKNLLAHNVDRNPRFGGGSAVIANNLVYDYKFGINTYDPKGEMLISIAGNYLIETPLTRWSMYIVAGQDRPGTRIYLGTDNYWDGQIQTDPWNPTGYHRYCKYWTPCDETVPEINRAYSPPLWPEGYIVMSAEDARTYVLANAGARPADRDIVDTRAVNQVENELCADGCIIESQDDVGGFPNLAENTRILTIPTNPHEIQPSGYTKLEEWLHGYLAEVEGKTTDPTPDNFTLQQNYPNPFNLSTTIEYTVAKPCDIQIKIYNLFGREVHVLVNEYKLAGKFSVTWDGKNAEGNELANGIYFYKLTAGKQSFSKKMLYIQSK
ncbi:MAG: T9SS type A sorting domain-containing protein [Bacteroidales bacterium]|nr:T9SS type A sorting domain-containing protein [Bacteroidales bacterium]